MPAGSSDSALGGELRLDDELCGQLGLGVDEKFRVLECGHRLLLLERCKAASGFALPLDRDLVLTANVQSFPLADILSMLHASGKSGFLAFVSGRHEKCVYLSRGEVVFASSNQGGDRIGECLLRAEMITLEQLREAESRWSRSDRFGKALVEQGILAPRELWNGVKFQVEEIVRSLFAYARGEVFFWEGEVQPDNVVRLSLPTQRLIAEGLGRRDELLRFVAELEDPRARLRRCGQVGRELSASSKMIFDAIGEEERFATVVREAGLDPVSTARTIQLLQVIGAVEIALGGDEGTADHERRSLEAEELRELVLDHLKLMEELVAPIVAVDGAAEVRERLGQLLEEVGESAPLLLGGLEPGPAGLLDPELVVRRALRLPAGRELTVRGALGELVSYLEFELKNHPRIEEPERFLDAVEGLRAKIDG